MVRVANLGSVNYAPSEPPAEPAALQRYLREELQKISTAIAALAAGHLDKTYNAPAKPRDGDIRYAAGAPNWNPGAGAGVYVYKSTAWVFLG